MATIIPAFRHLKSRKYPPEIVFYMIFTPVKVYDGYIGKEKFYEKTVVIIFQ